MNIILMLGALLGCFSVMIGAGLEHILKSELNSESYNFLETGVVYNQIHSLVIIIIGLFVHKTNEERFTKLLKFSGALFVIGTILFSYSIFFGVYIEKKFLLKLTPIGGLFLMVGWMFLAISAFFDRK